MTTAFPNGRMSNYEIRFLSANRVTLLAYVMSCESQPDVSRALAVAADLPYACYEVRRGIHILQNVIRTAADGAHAPLDAFSSKSSGLTNRSATSLPIS
jgi:hypothetical protein